MNNKLLDGIKRIKSIADIGLLYCSNEYDKERYLELQEISLQLLSKSTGQGIDVLKETLPVAKDYPTAKVDVRALILSSDDKKILLVKERVDGKWSLPGGWADIGYSPSEVIIKECSEETGLDIEPQKLLAVYDKRKHAHPAELFYIYKMVFYCKAISEQVIIGFDVLDLQYFTIDNLPELSEDRILKSQLKMLYEKILSSDFETYFD